MGAELTGEQLAGTNSVQERHRAALQVVLYGRSVEERKELLAALGLTPTRRRGPERPRGDYGHGHPARYSQGCRCEKCRAAHAARHAEAQTRRVADSAAADRAGHGKASTYQNYGCRCRPCTDANTAKSAAYKARRAKRAAVPTTTTADCPINTTAGGA